MNLLARLFSKDIGKKNVSGEKIRRIRLRKNISAADLGNLIGVNDTAIRNYETGYRNITDNKLSLIAQNLDIPVETLINREINSYTDIIHILFDLEDYISISPIEIPQKPSYVISINDELMIRAIQAWYEKKRLFDCGEISAEDFQQWKDSFPFSYDESELKLRPESMESDYSDFEKIIGLKSSLKSFNILVQSLGEGIISCLREEDIEGAYLATKKLIDTITLNYQVEIEKYK